MTVLLLPNVVCGGRLSTLWYQGLRMLGIPEVSLHEVAGLRQTQATVIAVGGNSLEGLEEPTARNIVEFRAPVLTHGNGPQVGALLLKYEGTVPLWNCVEETQTQIGCNVFRC